MTTLLTVEKERDLRGGSARWMPRRPRDVPPPWRARPAAAGSGPVQRRPADWSTTGAARLARRRRRGRRPGSRRADDQSPGTAPGPDLEDHQLGDVVQRRQLPGRTSSRLASSTAGCDRTTHLTKSLSSASAPVTSETSLTMRAMRRPPGNGLAVGFRLCDPLWATFPTPVKAPGRCGQHAGGVCQPCPGTLAGGGRGSARATKGDTDADLPPGAARRVAGGAGLRVLHHLDAGVSLEQEGFVHASRRGPVGRRARPLLRRRRGAARAAGHRHRPARLTGGGGGAAGREQAFPTSTVRWRPRPWSRSARSTGRAPGPGPPCRSRARWSPPPARRAPPRWRARSAGRARRRAPGRARRRGGAVEPLEDPLQVLGGTPGPVSATSSRAASPSSSTRSSTRPPGGVNFTAFVSRLSTTWPRRWASPWTGPTPASCTSTVSPRRRAGGAPGLGRAADDRAEVDRSEGHRHPLLPQEGEREQVVDEAQLAGGAALDHVEQPARGRADVLVGQVLEQLGVADDRGQRGAQLVGDGGDEVLAHPVRRASCGAPGRRVAHRDQRVRPRRLTGAARGTTSAAGREQHRAPARPASSSARRGRTSLPRAASLASTIPLLVASTSTTASGNDSKAPCGSPGAAAARPRGDPRAPGRGPAARAALTAFR